MRRTISIKCTYCVKNFDKDVIRLKNSKSGLYFCCRKHKDLAQSIDFGLKEIQPGHYKNGISYYKAKAFNHYSHKCENCGYNDIKQILEVHHIDYNRENNKLSNLIILCPICHRILTRKVGILKNRKIIQLC